MLSLNSTYKSNTKKKKALVSKESFSWTGEARNNPLETLYRNKYTFSTTYCYISRFKAATLWILTDIFLPAHFLEDVYLFYCGISDLLDLLGAHLIWRSDVDDLDCIFLSGALMDAASNHTAHPSATQSPSVTWLLLSISHSKPWGVSI